MIYKPYMQKTALAVFVFCASWLSFLSSSDSSREGQQGLYFAVSDTVDIIYSESVERKVIDEQPVQILTGSVRLRQDITLLQADKVTRYLTQDEILLEGNVLIIQETDSIYSEKVRYDTALKIGYASGNVRLSDGEVEVLAPSATHFVDEKRTVFDQNVQLIDSLTILTSLEGEYFSEPKRAEFYGDVILVEDNTYLESDSVTYFRDTEISLGYGNVFIERIEKQNEDSLGSSSRTFLFGDYVYNDNQQGYSSIEGNAFLFQVKEDSLGLLKDSLLIDSDRLEAIRLDSLERLVAVDSVRIWQRNFSAIADSAVYDRVSLLEKETQEEVLYEENRLYGGPVAWYTEYQLSGDSLLASGSNESIDSLFTAPNAFVAFLDTTTQKINQLQGESLLGLFAQDSLESLRMGPQAELIYFQQPEEGKIMASKISSDEITLLFDANQLSDLKAYSGIQLEYYDGSLIPEPFTLSRYSWLIEQKPVEETMLSRMPQMSLVEERLLEGESIVSRINTSFSQ